MELNRAVLEAMGEQVGDGQLLTVRFKDGQDGVRALAAFKRVHVMFRLPGTVEAILASGEFGSASRDQVLCFWPGFDWGNDDFVAAVGLGVESIEPLFPSPLQALMTGDYSELDRMMCLVVEEVLRASGEKGFDSLGLNEGVFFNNQSALPAIQVIVDDGLSDVLSVVLYGWSGSIKANGRLIAFCSSLPAAMLSIERAFDHYLASAVDPA